MEMLTVLCGRDLDDFTDFRASGSGERAGGGAYHESTERVFEWAEQLRLDLEGYFMYETLFFQTFESSMSLAPRLKGLDATLRMLARDPDERVLPVFLHREVRIDGESCLSCAQVPEKYEYFEQS